MIGKCTYMDKPIAVLMERTEDEEWKCADQSMQISDVSEWMYDGTIVDALCIKEESVRTLKTFSELLSEWSTTIMLLLKGR